MLSVQPSLSIEVAHDFASALGIDKAAGSNAILSTEEWERLLKSAASDVVFMTWQWQSLWWKHFGAPAQASQDIEECKLHLLAVRDEEGALVGIAPLFIDARPLPPAKEYRRGELRPEGEGAPVRAVRIVGGIDIADYLDIIAPTERMAEVWGVALDYLIERRDEWDVIDLHSLPHFSPSRELLVTLASQRGLAAEVFPEDVSPVLELPGDWETYLMSLRKKDRHELRRKVRKLEGRDDVRWRLVPPHDAEAMAQEMHIFLDLHRMSGVDKAHFMDDHMAQFFLTMASELAETGWLDLAILEVDKQPASAYLSFSYGDRLYLYNSGYSQQFAAYSAGVALLAYRIHKAILQGFRYFDFLRGDEPYKYDFGAKDTYVYRAMLT
ncbi:MAG TPA: GNAT family N-acetyltransferase [Chloroflexia bacterium]|nr:GNAT family N-acetyltransferase [Chloroflexia bacterium]